ncbi:MAG: hypothetical protein ABL904_27655 [Hyphomicrobiaceae bacterium]
MPAVKAGAQNQVPACATPGRLMAYLKERNPKLDSRFSSIATDYMQVGNQLQVRWDYAFFMMMVDTANLQFGREGRSGDVRAEQNNFAGLGATGKGERGERFPDVTTGVTAHLQHVLIYAGDKVPDAVAERTRKVQEWGVLTSWQKNIKGPISFAEVARRWAPGADDYGKSIETAAKKFHAEHCDKADPAPDLVAAVEPKADKSTAATIIVKAEEATEKVSGADLARNAIAAARTDAASGKRTGLGAANIAKSMPATSAPGVEAPVTAAAMMPGITILNAPKPDVPEKAAPDKLATVQPASAGALAKVTPSATASGKCRVWQASYGGQRAIIIKSKSEGFTNYTVLDVNEGAEKREAEAYIQAYAKGGETFGEFGSQNQALDKAFDLCPEG